MADVANVEYGVLLSTMCDGATPASVVASKREQEGRADSRQTRSPCRCGRLNKRTPKLSSAVFSGLGGRKNEEVEFASEPSDLMHLRNIQLRPLSWIRGESLLQYALGTRRPHTRSLRQHL